MSARTGSILFCGDPHGQFGYIVEAALATQPCAVVLLGDQEAQRPLHEELAGVGDRVWWIPGNHDTDTSVAFEHLWDSDLADRNLHGRVVTLPNGIRLAGLGGVFRDAVWHPDGPIHVRPRYRSPEEHAHATPRRDRWRDGPPRKHWSTIYSDAIDSLASQQADILVVHEAPGYHPHGVALLDTLAQSMGVHIVVHGHHHDALDSSSRWVEQGFQSFGVGLRGILSIDADGKPVGVRAGALDGARFSMHAHMPTSQELSFELNTDLHRRI